jgi:hypothetical protein
MLIKALSTFQDSPAVLKVLRMALSRRKKQLTCLQGSAPPCLQVGQKSPYVHLVTSWANAKPTSYLAWATPHSQPTDAQHIPLGPRLCPRHFKSRVKKLQHAVGNSCPPEGGVMYAAA